MQEEYDKSMMSLKINGKNYYYYKTKEVFSLPESIELEDEENVIIVLTDSFFDESKI